MVTKNQNPNLREMYKTRRVCKTKNDSTRIDFNREIRAIVHDGTNIDTEKVMSLLEKYQVTNMEYEKIDAEVEQAKHNMIMEIKNTLDNINDELFIHEIAEKYNLLPVTAHLLIRYMLCQPSFGKYLMYKQSKTRRFVEIDENGNHIGKPIEKTRYYSYVYRVE